MATNCENCSGMCYSNMLIRLSKEEADLLRFYGTNLDLLSEIKSITKLNENRGELKPILLEANRALYRLKGDCGCLLQKEEPKMRKCLIYESRPKSCKDMKIGGAECILSRIVSEAIESGYKF